MAHTFHPGQRWISDSEPELGLGVVARVTPRTVVITFGAAREQREYARDNAPLRRVQFRPGDTLTNDQGKALVVESAREKDGLIFYRGESQEWSETCLSAAISFSKPQERLLAGQLDEPRVFDLRHTALQQQHRRRKSKVRGFVGGRIDLIPHQLYIAAEVSGRLLPRVLLADEVGLGKTIEACLILHRLILTGRAQRVLIILPDSLVHQWFVELLRRFNLWFHIFDEERCTAIEAGNPETNPFLDDQLVITTLSLLVGNERRLEQAVAAGWDLLVVDEAHHLGWSPENPSPEYRAVEKLGRKTPGLLLLTATPEQLGVSSHFARLRLLDPDRFHDLAAFIDESQQYREVAILTEKLIGHQTLSAPEISALAKLLGKPEKELAMNLNGEKGSSARGQWIKSLLDQHGTGRVMFRNTRMAISGFPKRVAQMEVLDVSEKMSGWLDELAGEFAADTGNAGNSKETPDFFHDPRISWLVKLLERLGTAKVLLICRTQAKVIAIEAALRQQINLKIGMFHEGLTLVQRDRNAAWFAEEDGARILICSEIGSEGRNFQFAHHLVMFDLPLDPELLEQRIGRLDRIGQSSEIQVHVPYARGSSQEVLARWFNEGLDSFAKNLNGGRELLERYGDELRDLAQDFHETEATARAELDRLIAETKAARADLTVRLEQGRDRLLELNSFRPETSAELVRDISANDADPSLDQFMLAVFDHFSIHVEELSHRSYQLGSAGVFAESFPGLPLEGLTVTADRKRALAREDVQFLTWDHPLVTGALDLILGSEKGNSSFAKWPDAKVSGLYLETIYVLECIAPPQLHIDRFLPPTPLRVIVDQRGAECGKTILPEALVRQLKTGSAYAWLDQSEFREELLPFLLKQSEAAARQNVAIIIARAREEMKTQLSNEIRRLQELQKVNRTVRPEEIESLIHQQKQLNTHLAAARLRLDAIRLIQRGPS